MSSAGKNKRCGVKAKKAEMSDREFNDALSDNLVGFFKDHGMSAPGPQGLTYGAESKGYAKSNRKKSKGPHRQWQVRFLNAIVRYGEIKTAARIAKVSGSTVEKACSCGPRAHLFRVRVEIALGKFVAKEIANIPTSKKRKVIKIGPQYSVALTAYIKHLSTPTQNDLPLQK